MHWRIRFLSVQILETQRREAEREKGGLQRRHHQKTKDQEKLRSIAKLNHTHPRITQAQAAVDTSIKIIVEKWKFLV